MLNNINYETFWHNTLCRINHWERRHRGVSMISRNHFARTFLVIWHIYGILIMSWSLSSSRFVFRLYVLSTVHHSIHLCVLFLYIYIYSWSIFNSLARISIFAKKKGTYPRIDRIFIYQFGKIGQTNRVTIHWKMFRWKMKFDEIILFIYGWKIAISICFILKSIFSR